MRKGCRLAEGQVAPVTQVTQSDETLALRVTQGDEIAFKELYERFFKRVYVYVDKRLRNPADTEETVQEVFVNIFTSIDGYRGDAPFAAWVFGLTRRTIAGRFKRKQHPTIPLIEEDREAAMAGDGSSIPSPVEAYECEELLSRMEMKLDSKLSAEQRTLFELHHLRDHTIGEIAVALDKSENAVKSNLYRARKILMAR